MALRFLNSGYFAGKVGIGIETPTAPLDVFGVRAGRDWALTDRAVIRLDSNGAASPSDILFGHTAAANQTSWTGAYWSLSSRGSSAGNKFIFYRGNGNPGGSGEATIMTFDPDLNVGIGTTDPGTKLQVEGSIQANAQGRFKGWYTSGSGLALETGVSGGNGYVLTYNRDTSAYSSTIIESTGIQFVAHSSGKFYFTGGNVGIGVTSPGSKLDIVGSSLGIRVKKADLSDVLRVYTQGSGIFMDNGNVHISDDLKIGATLLSNQENTDIDTGAETVAEVSMADYTAAFFDFVIKKGTNVRSGTVYACHDGGSPPVVEFTETSTQDLGDTSDVVLSVDKTGSGGGSKMRLLATVTSDDWSVKSLIRAI